MGLEVVGWGSLKLWATWDRRVLTLCSKANYKLVSIIVWNFRERALEMSALREAQCTPEALGLTTAVRPDVYAGVVQGNVCFPSGYGASHRSITWVLCVNASDSQ